MKLLFLILNGLLPLALHAQDTRQYYFIEFSTVYESGLVDVSNDLLLLQAKEKHDSSSFEQYCFALCRKKIAGYNEALDTLANAFEIYSVRFSKNASGEVAERLLDRHSSFKHGYLIKMDQTRNKGPVIALLMKVYSREIASVDYKIIQSICPVYRDECAIEVSSVALK